MSHPSLTLSWSGHHTENVKFNGESVEAEGTRTIELEPGEHAFTLGVTVPEPEPDIPPPVHPDDPAKRDEHLAMLALVPRNEATHRAVKDGNWQDAATWGGSVPAAGSKVLVPVGRTVTIAGEANCEWLRVDGTLKFAPVDSTLTLRTWVCDAGSLTEIAPQGAHVNIVFIGGPLPADKDPLQLSCGLICHGTASVRGIYTEPDYEWAKKWTLGLVPDLARNITFQSADPTKRGHCMFMHTGQVFIEGARFSRLGRTDKSRKVTDPDGKVGGVDNPRGRYAVHFHKAGGSKTGTPIVIRGCAVDDSPGLGIVNHSSHVRIEDNTVYNVHGSGIFTEQGDELGTITGNVTLLNPGTPSPFSVTDSRGNFDFGHMGHGIWIQGGGTVEVANNVCKGFGHSGIIHMGAESGNYPTANLPDPSIWTRSTPMPSENVPLRTHDNWCEGTPAKPGIVYWAVNNPHYHHTDSKSERNTLVKCGISLGYSGFIHFKDERIINDINNPIGYAIVNTGASISGMTYENMHVEGWQVGLMNPCTEDGPFDTKPSRILGGYYNNVASIVIHNTQQGWKRTLEIDGKQTYATLPATALKTNRWPYYWSTAPVQPQWDIYLGLHFFSWNIASLEGWPYTSPMPEAYWKKLFEPNGVTGNQDVVKLGGEYLSYEEFGPGYSLAPLTNLPAEIRLKPDGTPRTTAELARDKSLYMGARELPAGAYQKPRIRGWLHSEPASFK